MNEQPQISVVVPTHNRAHLIERAIKSILAQTYQNLEIIILDDRSTDNIAEVVAGFGDQRIKFVRNKENLGGGGSRNVGIRASKSEYVAFLDDDDEWLPTKFEKQVKLFYEGSEKLGVVSCARAKFRDGKQFHEYWPECKGDVYQYLVDTCC